MSLKVEHISKKYGDFTAVEDLSFEMREPGVFALLGTNGAGKTTSIRMILGMLSADSGTVIRDGKPIKPADDRVGYLAEDRGLYPKYTVIDQINFFASLRSLGKADTKREIDHWFGRLGIDEYRNKNADQLSKGNQQKVQLASTLVHNPEIVILDEPFSGLDPVNSQILKDVINELIAEDRLVIFSSHQMSYVEEFCDHIAIIDKGEVTLAGELKEIKREYGRNRLVLAAEDVSPAQLKERAEQVLNGLVKVSGEKKEFLILELIDGTDRRQVLERLAGSDISVGRFGSYEPSLNDIFVEKVGEESEKD